MTHQEKYDELEKDVINALKKRIEESSHDSTHTKTKAIKIRIFGYKEITVINGTLTFLDDAGYRYSLFGDCTLLDLIAIAEGRYDR